MSGTATERPTVDELVRRAGAWCDRHPGAELLTTYHALARRYGVTPANATTEAPDGGAVPVGEPTGADRRGWEIKEPEPAYPLSERDYHACGRDFTPAAQRRRGLVARRARPRSERSAGSAHRSHGGRRHDAAGDSGGCRTIPRCCPSHTGPPRGPDRRAAHCRASSPSGSRSPSSSLSHDVARMG